MTDAVRKRFTFVLVLALASFGLLLFDAGPAEAVTPPPECGAATADYPQNHFRVCFFSGTNPAMEDNYLGTENEPSVANPVPDRIFAINRQWRTYPTPDWIADVVYDPACTDGFDNDGVGGIDANDIDCAPIGEGPIGATACFDGIDNDGDGLIDYDADPGCHSPPPDESPPRCADGFDNDTDGPADSSDPDCQWRPDGATHEGPTLHTTCYDRVDNDFVPGQPSDGIDDYYPPNPPDPGCAQPPPHEGPGPTGPGRVDDISGVWRGRFNFPAGRYQFTVYSDDGMRLFIDTNDVPDNIPDPILDKRSDVNRAQPIQDSAAYTAAVQFTTPGYRNVRVEWFDPFLSAQLRLHWDRAPDVSNPRVSPAVVDVFVVQQQDFCIVGHPYVSGVPISIRDPKGTPDNPDDDSDFKQWQDERVTLGLPKAVKPSDLDELASYPWHYCSSFGFRPEEITYALAQITEFEQKIENWTLGAFDLKVEVNYLQGELPIAAIGDTSTSCCWWVHPSDVANATRPYVTRDTDFTILLASTHEIGDRATARSYANADCGLEASADGGLWGTGYEWVPHTSMRADSTLGCLNSSVMANEWEHQLAWLVTGDGDNGGVLGLDSIYPTHGPFPPCGAGAADTFSWYLDHYASPFDPASQWCGWDLPSNPSWPIKAPAGPGTDPQIAANLLWHFDTSLAHYPTVQRTGFFTGNHCNDGIQNVWPGSAASESGIDVGGNCPSTCSAGDTGYMNPTAEDPDTGGDGNGFESNPTNAFANDAFYATNVDGAGDNHRYFNYDISLPADCGIAGIEVRADWWVDDPTGGDNSMDVELSGDGGATWTAAKSSTTESAGDTNNKTVGGPEDPWARNWTPAQLANPNFRVRVTSKCTGNQNAHCNLRDFSLDWVGVKVYYTPFHPCSANAPVTSNSGDNNGFQTAPAEACTNRGGFAEDPNSGNNNHTTCGDTGKDRHTFYNYGFAIPPGSTINGIEVRLDSWADNTSGSPSMCVELSSDGGTTWTDAKTTALTTSESSHFVGSGSDTWGHTWMPTDFSDANFRVRVTNVASTAQRNFRLDWIAVAVTSSPRTY